MFRFSRYDWADDLHWGDPWVTCRHHRFADDCEQCEEEAYQDALDASEEEFWAATSPVDEQQTEVA